LRLRLDEDHGQKVTKSRQTFLNHEIHGEFTATIHGHVALQEHRTNERFSLREQSLVRKLTAKV